jgi:hypothetical protein
MAGREHNSPKSAPTRQPANGNKQPHGTMSIGCGRLFRLGLAVQVVSERAESFHAQAPVLALFLPAAHQREAASVPHLTLESISAWQNRRTSPVF